VISGSGTLVRVEFAQNAEAAEFAEAFGALSRGIGHQQTVAKVWTRMRPRQNGRHLMERDAGTERDLHHLSAEETAELEHLREVSPARGAAHVDLQPPLFRERLADAVAEQIGSWRFLLIQTIVLAGWITANVIGWMAEWDPYPFILLNLILSFQAAYTAPIIMMSQNRQAGIDRQRSLVDSEINLQAALEVKSLHEKVDTLIAAVQELHKDLNVDTAPMRGLRR
jgi:uncharacterized membrane protein